MPKWVSILLHVLVILGGVAGSIKTKNIAPLVGTGAVNALLTSPLHAGKKDENTPAAGTMGGIG
jgi:hypothetical protein